MRHGVKRTIILLAALFSLGLQQSSPASAQSASGDAAILSAAQPAIDALLKALPQGSTLSPTQVFTDDVGQAHVRLAQSYKGLPVFEGEAIIHLDAATNRVIGTTNATLPFASVNITPGVSAERASEMARSHFAQAPGLASKRDLTILVTGGKGSLAWKVRNEGGAASGRHTDTVAFVGAQDGKVIRAWDNLHTSNVPGTAKGMFMDLAGSAITVDQTAATTFYLRNAGTPNYYTCDLRAGRSNCYSITSTSSTFGTGTITTSGPNAAADAQFGAEKTLSYYKAKFGRNGINNANMPTYSRVHYGRGYENAFWSDTCSCMTYGDGASTFYPLVSIDVAGHEMSHGVTSRTANLTYAGESGGLNEATSDIFGTMVEYYAKGSFDAPDYLIGEMIWKSNWKGSTSRVSFSPAKALRYMYNPELDGASKNCWYSGIGSLDVHYSSGIANHFFYLLAEGSNTAGMPVSPTCNSSTLAGIGRDKAEQIWYRALTVYMTASTNYAGARAATIAAANDLYDADKTDQVPAAEAVAVAAAWAAVSVN
jgi:Zn-dependent metalloprotease